MHFREVEHTRAAMLDVRHRKMSNGRETYTKRLQLAKILIKILSSLDGDARLGISTVAYWARPSDVEELRHKVLLAELAVTSRIALRGLCQHAFSP